MVPRLKLTTTPSELPSELMNDLQVSLLVHSINNATKQNTTALPSRSATRPKILDPITQMSNRVPATPPSVRSSALSTTRSVPFLDPTPNDGSFPPSASSSSALSTTRSVPLLDPTPNDGSFPPSASSSTPPSKSSRLVLTNSPAVSSLVQSLNRGHSLENLPLKPIRTHRSQNTQRSQNTRRSQNTQRSPTSSRRSRPETNRSNTSLRSNQNKQHTARSTLGTSRSTSSIHSARYTARQQMPWTYLGLNSTRSSRTARTTTAPTTTAPTTTAFTTTAPTTTTSSHGQYKPWNHVGLSKRGMRSRQINKELRQSFRRLGNVDLVAQTLAQTQQEQHGKDPATAAMSIVDRETMAEQFNAILDNSLVEQAARLQLRRGGRLCKAIHKVDSLRGPGALYLKAKGDVAVHIDPPEFSTLGKTIGALANKTSASTMSEGKGMTTSGGTYIPQSYASTYKDRQIFTNVKPYITTYLEKSMKHEQELRGESLLVPKSRCFIKMQSHEDIQKRQMKRKKFKAIKQIKENYVSNLNHQKIVQKHDNYNMQRIQRIDKEKRLGLVPGGKRIGGGYTGVVKRKLKIKTTEAGLNHHSNAVTALIMEAKADLYNQKKLNRMNRDAQADLYRAGAERKMKY